MANPLSKLDYNAPVVLTFALVSLGVLGLDLLTGGWTTTAFFCVYRSSLLDPFFYVRLFGHVLGHANLAHYLGNMTLFMLVGPMMEEKYGSKRLLAMIAATALVTGVVHIVISPTGLLGASGVVFMLIVLSSVACGKEGKIPVTLIVVVALYLGDQVVEGISSADDISQLTHIVGGVLGMVFGLAMRPRGEGAATAPAPREADPLASVAGRYDESAPSLTQVPEDSTFGDARLSDLEKRYR